MAVFGTVQFRKMPSLAFHHQSVNSACMTLCMVLPLDNPHSPQQLGIRSGDGDRIAGALVFMNADQGEIQVCGHLGRGFAIHQIPNLIWSSS